MCGGCRGHQVVLLLSRKLKLEIVSQSGKMQMSYKGMFDLLTPAVPGEFPLTHPMDRLLCEATCTPVAKQAGVICNPPPPKKGWPLNSQASGNICSPEIHTSCQLGSGWAQGLEKGLLGCSCGRRRKSRPGSFVALEGWGLSWAV